MKIWSTSGGSKIIRVLAGRSNVFLVTNNKSNILVDTSPQFMWKTLQKRLNSLHVESVDLLILTHSHFDHAANAANIKRKYNATVIIHKSEAGYLATGDNILPVGTNTFSKFLVRTFAKQFESIARYPACQSDIMIDDYYDLTAYGFNGYLIHTPGHTIGSISMIIDDEIALVGDTMFGIFRNSVYPPFASDEDLLLKSWGKLLSTDCHLFIPSHGSANKRFIVEKDLSIINRMGR